MSHSIESGRRNVSEPAALGLAAFGLTTMALSFINAGILLTKILPMLGTLALAYGGLVQLLAGFRREVLPVFENRSAQQDVGP